jgi:hypothetical protein
MPSTRRHHHHVYVVELDARVWKELRFRKANPDHQLSKPLVYVPDGHPNSPTHGHLKLPHLS